MTRALSLTGSAGAAVACANGGAADIISTVEFDQTGNYLATGDKGGRVVLFERNETVRCCPAPRSLASSAALSSTDFDPRKRHANTSSTQSSSHTSRSLIT